MASVLVEDMTWRVALQIAGLATCSVASLAVVLTVRRWGAADDFWWLDSGSATEPTDSATGRDVGAYPGTRHRPLSAYPTGTGVVSFVHRLFRLRRGYHAFDGPEAPRQRGPAVTTRRRWRMRLVGTAGARRDPGARRRRRAAGGRPGCGRAPLRPDPGARVGARDGGRVCGRAARWWSDWSRRCAVRPAVPLAGAGPTAAHPPGRSTAAGGPAPGGPEPGPAVAADERAGRPRPAATRSRCPPTRPRPGAPVRSCGLRPRTGTSTRTCARTPRWSSPSWWRTPSTTPGPPARSASTSTTAACTSPCGTVGRTARPARVRSTPRRRAGGACR